MNKYLGTVIFLIIVWYASMVSAQSLWNGTYQGMTEKELMSLVPGLKRPSYPRQLPDGSAELLRRENIILVNNRFFASFYFKEDKLKQVTLFLDEDYGFERTLLVFEEAKQSLVAKYGPEIDYNEEHIDGFLDKFYASWVVGESAVGLLLVSVNESDATLSISYQAGIPSEGD